MATAARLRNIRRGDHRHSSHTASGSLAGSRVHLYPLGPDLALLFPPIWISSTTAYVPGDGSHHWGGRRSPDQSGSSEDPKVRLAEAAKAGGVVRTQCPGIVHGHID